MANRLRLSPLPTALALAALVVACGPSGEAPGPAPAVHAAYVLLATSADGSTVPFARVITDPDSACPRLVGTGEAGDGIATAPRRNPHGFPVRVCEAVYPFERSLGVAGTEVRLPAVTRDPRRVAVLGDTGCKPKDQGGCSGNDPSVWPLPALARAAAASGPDLVLHMGDYNYRGTPGHFEGTVDGRKVENQWVYDAGDGAPAAARCEVDGPYYSQNSSGSTDPDAWEDWWLDFFQPARELLAAAPWVFARGNHELCSRAGPGWFYFLGPASDLPAGGGEQTACPDQDGLGPALPHLRFVPPYTVRLGELAVSVVDTANACDALPNFVDRYREQFAALSGGPGAETHWIMGHRPLWGADGPAKDAGYDCAGQPATGPQPTYSVINRTLECALSADAGASLLAGLDLALAGHMHRFEWLEFAAGSGRPPSLIVGNSGVELNTDAPNGSFGQTVDGLPASGFGLDQFGYVELARGESGWSGAVVAVDARAWSGLLPDCGAPEASGAFLCVRPL